MANLQQIFGNNAKQTNTRNIRQNGKFSEILKNDYTYFLAVTHSFFKSKNFLKYFGFIYLLYFIGIFGLLIADVYHRDDIWRTQGGNPSFLQASRRLSQVLSYFFHASYPKIADISPFSQLIAIAFLSIASMIVVKIVNKKISYSGLTASLMLGLNPWYLQCLSYKYDSIFMSLATLCAILPFLFKKRIFLFSIVSVFLLVCMWNLYQANNGIYLIMAFFIIFDLLLQKSNFKQIIVFFAASSLSFILAALIYKFIFFVEPNTNSYIGKLISVDVNMAFNNIKKLLSWINQTIGTHVVKYLFFVSILFFAIAMFEKRKINFIAAVLLIVLFLSIGIFVSYGTYIILSKFDTQARTIAQIGGFFAIVTIGAISQKHKVINFISKCIIFYLSYTLITISSTYANALDAQDKFDHYRINLMMSDLEHLLPINPKVKVSVFITSKRLREPYSNIYRQVTPIYINLTSQITNTSVYQLREKGINAIANKTCKKENEKSKKSVETRFHKIETFGNNCYEVTFK